MFKVIRSLVVLVPSWVLCLPLHTPASLGGSQTRPYIAGRCYPSTLLFGLNHLGHSFRTSSDSSSGHMIFRGSGRSGGR